MVEVIKVGGSLLSSSKPPARSIERVASFVGGSAAEIVVGGGELVEQLRRRSALESWTDRRAHWTAIALMDRQARTLARMLAIGCVEPVASNPATATVCLTLYRTLRRSPDALPIGWHVTSDSIAAWWAGERQAPRLTMLKSIGPADLVVTDAQSIAQLANWGWVDPYFPTIWQRAGSPPLRWVNLRAEEPSIISST